MDKTELAKKIREIEGLTNEERSELLALLNSRKRYGLVWEDKPEEAEEILKTHIPVLTEVKDKEINHDTETQKNPNHILIEGDNLHALTSLCYTHEGKIDVIYIDPPYNTGNKDFVYNDSYVDSEDSYRHSKWLSFMNKRLRIAKRLLSDKGVIFISIDDNEQANLKLLCDEVFGDNNYITSLPRKGIGGRQDSKYYAIIHEYILVFAKKIEYFESGRQSKTVEYKYYDDLRQKKYNKQLLRKWGDNSRKEDRPNLFYPIYYNPITFSLSIVRENDSDIEIFPMLNKNKEGCWRWGKPTMQEGFNKGLVEIQNNGGIIIPYERIYEKEENSSKPFSSWIDDIDSSTGTKLLKDILDNDLFGYPKPSDLIKRIIMMASPLSSPTILDFFAGSGTTLHATMQLNAEDGGHRQCILVTNNENDICEKVTYERNKRVINGYTTPKGVAVEGLKANNLRYFRCEMKPRELSHQSKRELVMAMTDILRIKEDIYTEQTQFGSLPLHGKARLLRYFADGDKRMLIVYDTRVLPFVIKEIRQMEGSIKIYLFADGAYPYTEDFRSVMDKVELVALPHAFSQALKHVLPPTPEEAIEAPDLTEEEQAAMMEEAIEAENNEEQE